MRKLIIAAGALAFAVPVAAQTDRDRRDDEIVRALPHPGEIEELGVAPGPALSALEQAILRHDIAAVPGAGPAAGSSAGAPG